MGKKLLIDATHAEETRVVVVDGNKVEEFDFETIHKRQLAGNIYLAKITRVEPSLQAAFVDYGGNRHGFLAFAEIHPDYYQIPVADRAALLAEERALARAQDRSEDDTGGNGSGNGANGRRSRRRRSGGGSDDSAPSREAGEEVTAEDADDRDDLNQHTEAQPEAVEAPAQAAPAEAVTDTPDAEGTADEAIAAPVAGDTAVPPVEETPTEPAVEAPQHDGNDPAPAETDDTPDAPKGGSMAANAEGMETRTYGAMDVVDLDDDGAEDEAEPNSAEALEDRDDDKPYRAADHASDNDDEVESVADEDVSDEVRPPRRPRAKRYKIQEVIKVRQIMLVQVVKEERGNKGAALTTYLSLAGRYCVLMPNTARGGGISRKITNAADRKKLKEIAGEISVPEGAGLIIRTAGAQRTKPEIRRDYEYLFRVWEQIRELTLKSVAPAPIYEEGNLIKRSIRDLYNKDIDEVLVEGEAGYRTAKDFMKMIMPSHAKNVQLYRDQMPLFARFQVETYLGSMFNPTVQLKSGGYIVIGITEALVAIDVNSGKSTREGSIEDTALKTNLEAADEVARQLRLRDLAGLIVIDFIDMEERRNNAAVEKRMKDALRTDRARIQVGRISAFGLMEMSRQRLRPGMLEATTQPCAHCHGTGLIRSDNSLALQILRSLEEEGTRNRSKEVLVKAPIEIVNYLFNAKREHLAQIEVRYGMAIRLEADTSLISPDYTIEKFKTATRIVTAPVSQVVSLDAQTMSDIDADLAEAEDAELVDDRESAPEDARAETPESAEAGDAGDGSKRKRRRRRRRRGGQNGDQNGDGSDDSASDSDDAETGDGDAAESEAQTVSEAATDDSATEEPAKPVRKRRTRTRAKKADEPTEGATAPEAETSPDAASDGEPAPKKRTRTRRKPKPAEEAPAEASTDAAAAGSATTEPVVETAPQPVLESASEPVSEPAAAPVETTVEAAVESASPEAAPVTEAEAAPIVEPEGAAPQAPTAEAPDAEVEASETTPAPEPDKPAKPRRAGWWSRG
jgi:ribonuclease E